jgi:hypothetical protein
MEGLDLFRSFERSASFRAAIILGLVVLLAYGDIVLLGYSINPSIYSIGVLTPPYGYHGRWIHYSPVIDPLAVGGAINPAYVLIDKFLTSFRLPLWNPYQGTGAPLGADTTWGTYFPLHLLHILLPNQYWDFVWLLELWLAGFLAYLLFRKLGVGHVAGVGGGAAYSLSGAFILYPFVPWSDVAILTPALLLTVWACFNKRRTTPTIIIGAIVFAASILGAHMETLIIQFLFVNLFVVFEAVGREEDRLRGLRTWVIVVALGLGLSSFFLLPVFEYLQNAALGHAAGAGAGSFLTDGNPAVWWISLFIPYFYGFVQTYPYSKLGQVFSWNIFPGYVGTTVLYLSILPALSKFRKTKGSKYYWFFAFSTIAILMKLFGVPPISWIGLLPVLNYVIFERFAGSFLAISFAGCCAFGIDAVRNSRIVEHDAKNAFFVSLILLGSGLLGGFGVLSLHNSYFIASIAYGALSLVLLTLCVCVASKGGRTASGILTAFVILELVAYLPRSLTIQYEAARTLLIVISAFVLALLAMEKINVLSFLKIPRIPRFVTTKQLLSLVLILALIIQFLIAASSPGGLPNRYDSLTPAPYVHFLEDNAGIQRVYSLDGTFFPPVAGVYSIQSIGEFSSLMPNSFERFVQSNLDTNAPAATFVGNAWFRNDTPSAVAEIRANLPFYSLMGVKYFVMSQSDLSVMNETLLEPGPNAVAEWVPLGSNIARTRFVTSIPFDGLYLWLGTVGNPTSGEIVINIDGLGLTVHRQSQISAASFLRGGWSLFKFDKINVTGTNEFNLSVSQTDTRVENEAAVMAWSQVVSNPSLQVASGFPLFAIGLTQRDPQTASGLPIVYQDQNATIYENLHVFARAFLVSTFILAPNDTVAIDETHFLGWNTRHTAVLEMTSPPIGLMNSTQVNAGNVEVETYSPDQVTLRVNALQPSILILTDTYYPGWHAYLDGAQQPIYRAYGTVRAVVIQQAGAHELVFRYEPESFMIGSILSGVSLVVLLVLLVAGIIGEKRSLKLRNSQVMLHELT